MENLNIEAVSVAVALLTTMVIGATELVKRLFDRDWRAVVIIAVSALIGGIGGVFVVPSIGLAVGIVIGLGASGLVTVAQNVGLTKTIR